ncbi:MAG: hypothetical protein ACRD3L_05925 [Terriglobales bacterium]
MTKPIRTIAMTFVIAVFTLTSAAVAQSYTGDWPATVTHSQRSDGTYCISLTDDGSYGARHSGEAKLIPNQSQYPGYFTVVDGLMTVTITYPSGPGDCCSFQVFTARAGNGQIGKGVFNYFGPADVGLLTFGKKNGCSM